MSANLSDAPPKPKGRRFGGRQKGAQNKSVKLRKMSAAQGIAMAQAARVTPLEVLLGIINRDKRYEDVTDRELHCVALAIPYCHSRLAAIAYVPAPDMTGTLRRQALAGLNYQQRKQIEQILLSASGVIEGDPLSTEETEDE